MGEGVNSRYKGRAYVAIIIKRFTKLRFSFYYSFSLKKSERALTHKSSHKSGKSSEVKRAKKRIKESEKTLKDIPKSSGTDFVYETVVEQVTHLCQKLMQIPMTLSIHGNNLALKSRTFSPSFNNDSDDTDTDNTDDDTNGSKPLERPRSNSDSREAKYYRTYRTLRYSPGLEKSKHKRKEITKEYRNGMDNFLDDYLERFKAIGYIPNDSESSEGSLRSDSPGPLRGYPLSLTRRPSSAGRAERQSFHRDRSSSLPLLNIPIRRCHTPTPSSNGHSLTTADFYALSRYRNTNGTHASSNVFGRREKNHVEIQRPSPVSKHSISNERSNRQKTGGAQHYNKDEILTSYQRDAENLIKRQCNIYSPTDIQNKLSSSDGSDSNKSPHNDILNKSGLDSSFNNLQTNCESRQTEGPEDSSRREEYYSESRQAIEQTNSGTNTPYRMTPKRLLPKVPAGQGLNSTKGSSIPKVDIYSSPGAEKLLEHLHKNKAIDTICKELPICKEDSQSRKPSFKEPLSKESSTNTTHIVNNTEDSIENKIVEKITDIQHAMEDTEAVRQRDEAADQTSLIHIELNNRLQKLKKKTLDIEEIKFKENIRTARRDIIDKLRSKYSLPRREHESSPDITIIEPIPVIETTKSDMENQQQNLQQTCNEAVSKTSLCSKHNLNSPNERHSPVMSIAGLKRYKSTTNLSKLESFDKATSKFEDKQTDAKTEETTNEAKYINSTDEENENKINSNPSSESNEPTAVIDPLSKSLTFESNHKRISLAPLDRQGLLRSASVENVGSYQFLDSLSSCEQLNSSLYNQTKESGISTLSFDELNSNNENNDQTLVDDSFCYTNNSTIDESPKVATSSSDNGFDSGEGLGNSEDSVDEVEPDSSTEAVKNETKDVNHPPKLYPAKLIHIDKNSKHRNITDQEKLMTAMEVEDKSVEKIKSHTDRIKSSNVRTVVEKLENSLFTRSRPEKRTLKQFKENSMERKVQVRSRSASASRNPASVYGDMLPTSARALQPRGRLRSASEAVEPKPQLSSLLFSVKKSRSIEADLNKICQEETAESIRREWINRRSSSASRKPDVKLPVPTVRSIFEYDTSRQLPSPYLRSQLSGFVSLQNGKFVIIDQLQMNLYLMNTELRVVSEIKLDCIPCGICVTGSNSFAIAFPYKGVIRVYYVVKDRVTHTRDIKLGCNEWITDVNHRKGRLHVLCKGGHIHILGITGREENTIDVGMTGKLQLNEAGNRFYIHSERQIIRFNDKGEIIWTKSDINASCMLLFNDKLYIIDADKEKIVTLSEIGDTRDLVSKDIQSVSAACLSYSSDRLYICHYADELDDESTRRISIFKKH